MEAPPGLFPAAMPPDREGPFGLLPSLPSFRPGDREKPLGLPCGSSGFGSQTRCFPLASTARGAFCTKGRRKPPAGRASIMMFQSLGILRRPQIFPIQPCLALGSDPALALSPTYIPIALCPSPALDLSPRHYFSHPISYTDSPFKPSPTDPFRKNGRP